MKMFRFIYLFIYLLAQLSQGLIGELTVEAFLCRPLSSTFSNRFSFETTGPIEARPQHNSNLSTRRLTYPPL